MNLRDAEHRGEGAAEGDDRRRWHRSRRHRSSSRVHPDLDNAAIEAVRQWQFDGTLLNCTPVEVTMNVAVDFRRFSRVDEASEPSDPRATLKRADEAVHDEHVTRGVRGSSKTIVSFVYRSNVCMSRRLR